MKGSKKYGLRWGIGLLIGGLFVYAALRRVDGRQMWQALKDAHYWYVLPAVATVFLSHYFRAFRWRYLLDPIKRADTTGLFSALVIGYAANAVIPAHLGEFLRAYVLSKKKGIPLSSLFATIVVERIIDIFSLIAVMLLAVFLYPFPPWVIQSGYIMFGGALGLFICLVFLKLATGPAMRMLAFFMTPFPRAFQERTRGLVEGFVSGMAPLRRRPDYVMVALLSVLIWACYGLVFHFCLQAFDFIQTFHLNWSVSLILLAITTIAVVVPSSPGYVGTYHYLCQITLATFAVPDGPALSFALLAHGINIFPVLMAGIIFAHYEGVAILETMRMDKEAHGSGPVTPDA